MPSVGLMEKGRWVATTDGDTIKAKVYGKVEAIRYLLVDTPKNGLRMKETS